MARNRFVLMAATLATAALIGCQQHYFMTRDDFDHYRSQAITQLPPPPSSGGPEDAGTLDKPADVRDVLHPDAKERNISLVECMALALENGRTGDFYDRPGSQRSQLIGLFGAGGVNISNNTDAIRVFMYDPALVGADMEVSLSRFDAIWQTNLSWQKQDEPRNVLFGLTNVQNTTADQSSFQTQLLKPLPTGGMAGLTFRNTYELSNINERFGRFNPSYQPNLDFSIDQPLLRGAGVGVNQILSEHPGSNFLGFRPAGATPGIVLTRLAYEQQQIEYERRIHDLVFFVESAYWQLYGAYWDLYSRETALLQAHAAWQVADERFRVGKIAGQEFYQIQEQFHNFRAQRLQALGSGTGGRPGVLEAERNLRYLVGLPPEDGERLIPSDVPTTAAVRPSYAMAIREGLAKRPELQQARIDLRAAEILVLRDKNNGMPDLRVLGRYNVNSLGSQLDGSSDTNALRNLVENSHNDWEIGLRLEVLLGYREANANVRKARLRVGQRVAFLQDEEQKLAFSVNRAYRSIIQLYEEIRIQQSRREAAALTLRLRFQEFESGKGTVDTLLESQRNFADALREEQFSIIDYNVALIDLERQKGTILEYDNVRIVDAPLPACAACRASEHIRERQRSWPVVYAHADQPAGDAPNSPLQPVAKEVPGLNVPPAAPVSHLVEATQGAAALPERLSVPEGVHPVVFPRRVAPVNRPNRPPASILPPSD